MTGHAIVAIPRKDDPVWKYSSEKVPHMTLLFLGDQTNNPDLPRMLEYLQHVVTNQGPFTMVTKERGLLGSEDADVLFFAEDRHGKARASQIRDYLLDDTGILKAWHSVEQYPQWTPHLTMGYPKTPAKEDDRAYRDYYCVEFDRIAWWTGDYTGPEFKLEYPELSVVDMAMADAVDAFLAHHGVKGMKWGVRKRYDEARNRELFPETKLTTAKGVEVTIREDRTPPAQAALAAVSSKFRNFIAGGHGFSISVDGKEVGEAAFKEKSKEEINLAWITVDKEHRGQGYATVVFDSAVAYAKSKGFSRITLEVPGNAPDALHIYKKFGFKADGEIQGDKDDVWGGLQPMVYKIPKGG